jgi:hypothetical protein
MRAKAQGAQDEMRVAYDFDYSTAVRGKYYRRLMKEGANVVMLEPHVAKAFRSSAAANEARRSLIKVARAASGRAEASAPSARKRRALVAG